jgi:hypothetical protein
LREAGADDQPADGRVGGDAVSIWIGPGGMEGQEKEEHRRERFEMTY